MLHATNASIAGGILATLILLPLILDKRRKPEQHARPARRGTDDPFVSQPGQQHPTEEQHRSHEEAQWRWERRIEQRRDWVAMLTLVLSVAAFVAAWFSYQDSHIQARAAQDQLTLSRRDQLGWIDPLRVRIGSVENFGPDFTTTALAIAYFNIGNFPSSRQHTLIDVDILGPYSHLFGLGDGDADNRKTAGPQECSLAVHHTLTNTRSAVIWPGTPEHAYFQNISWTGSKETARSIANGYGSIRVKGCFTYETNGEQHRSWFCEYFVPQPGKPMTEWGTMQCVDGNGAD